MENSLQREQARLGQLRCLVFLLSVDVGFSHLRERTPSSFYPNSSLHQLLSDRWFVSHPGKTRGEGFTWATRAAWLRGKLCEARPTTKTIPTHPRRAAWHEASLSCRFASAFSSICLLKSVLFDFRGTKARLDHRAFQDLR